MTSPSDKPVRVILPNSVEIGRVREFVIAADHAFSFANRTDVIPREQVKTYEALDTVFNRNFVPTPPKPNRAQRRRMKRAAR